MATVIASQAVISGAFSLTQQAIQLGYSPRFDIHHTSAHEKGQVYIPEVNWLLMFATVGLVFGFRTSTNLAAAYGMAVTTTMVITTMLAYFVARERWGWSLCARRLRHRRASWSSTWRSSARTSSRSSTAAGSRCWSRRGDLRGDDDLATGRQLVVRRLAESEVPLTQFFASVAAQAAGARAGHRHLHDRAAGRRAADSGAPPDAQQGAARAGRPADGVDRRRADGRSGNRRLRVEQAGERLLAGGREVRLHGRADVPAALERRAHARPRLARRGHHLLSGAPDAVHARRPAVSA